METKKTATAKFNEVANVKMSAISKSRRPAARMRKEFATRILFETDNLQALKGELDLCEKFNELAELRPYVEAYIAALKPAKKQTKKAEAPKEKKTDTTAQPAKRGAAPKHVVGEVHPNGKWIWTDLGNGKCDWKSKNGKWHGGKENKHNEGDIHENGKWAWLEWRPGKFDWKSIKSPLYAAYLERTNAEAKRVARRAKRTAKKTA